MVDLSPGLQPTSADTEAEPVFYYGSSHWYHGAFPAVYDASKLPGTAILEDNFETIRDEILTYYAEHRDGFTVNFTPYGYREPGWQTINMISYFIEYGHNCRKLPKTMKLLRRIPGLSLAQVSVLAPHTRIKAHLGDSNVIIRSHLGVAIPGALPEVGLRICRTDLPWVEGKVLAFCDARRHFVWNDTARPRIVVIVDVFRDEYRQRQYAIAGNVLATIAMKAVATRFPRTKRIPEGSLPLIRRPLGMVFRALLFCQRILGLPVQRLVGRA